MKKISSNAAHLDITPAILILTGQLRTHPKRGATGTGDKIFIGGFIVDETAPKEVLVRGMGPVLSQFGITNALQDPTLQLFCGPTAIASNDNWQTDPNHSQIPSNKAPADTREAALLTTLVPGAYTAIEAGKNGATGIGLVEAYDMDPTAQARLINGSTRGSVETGEGVLTGGFITNGGYGTTKVLIRALGPTLFQFNVPNTLADPILTVHDINGNVITSNDNWKNTNEAGITATRKAPPNDLEAILLTATNGNYTAIVSGKNGITGIGLIEVYKQ